MYGLFIFIVQIESLYIIEILYYSWFCLQKKILDSNLYRLQHCIIFYLFLLHPHFVDLLQRVVLVFM